MANSDDFGQDSAILTEQMRRSGLAWEIPIISGHCFLVFKQLPMVRGAFA
jgi:hypothetical protein